VLLFLLNSSGAVILFVYLLIAVSQLVLRRRTPEDQLVVKMWLFPFLTILTVGGVLAVLVQLGANADTRSQLLLGLGSWGVALVAYVVTRAMGGSVTPARARDHQEEPAGRS
jgi:GABA permease